MKRGMQFLKPRFNHFIPEQIHFYLINQPGFFKSFIPIQKLIEQSEKQQRKLEHMLTHVPLGMQESTSLTDPYHSRCFMKALSVLSHCVLLLPTFLFFLFAMAFTVLFLQLMLLAIPFFFLLKSYDLSLFCRQ